MPIYFEDYVMNETHETRVLQNLTIFSPREDLTTFKEVVKHEIWRKTVDLKFEVIQDSE